MVSLEIELFKAEPEFWLQSASTNANKFKIHYKSLQLRMKRLKINPDLVASHEAMLLKTPARYPFFESRVNFISLGKDQTQLDLTSIYDGLTPATLLLGFLKTTQLSRIDANPFEFKNRAISSLQLMVTYTSILNFKNHDPHMRIPRSTECQLPLKDLKPLGQTKRII